MFKMDFRLHFYNIINLQGRAFTWHSIALLGPGRCRVLDTAWSWTLQGPGRCSVRDAAGSWTLQGPGRCRVLDAELAELAELAESVSYTHLTLPTNREV